MDHALTKSYVSLQHLKPEISSFSFFQPAWASLPAPQSGKVLRNTAWEEQAGTADPSAGLFQVSQCTSSSLG